MLNNKADNSDTKRFLGDVLTNKVDNMEIFMKRYYAE